MIFDRTQSDVSNALEIRENVVKQFGVLNEDQIQTLERGFITINTLNRIESKQRELVSLFNSLGYWNVTITTKTNWKHTDIFDEIAFSRILTNTNTLRKAFFVFSSTPITPPISYHYEDINSLEKILFDLEEMAKAIQENYRECGAYECGEESVS